MASVQVYDNPEFLAEKTAIMLKEISDKTISENGKINIALSGGSTPKELFRVVNKNFLNEFNWSGINIYWADERCVSPENPESNYGEAERILLRNIPYAENIHRIKGENNPEAESKRYSSILRQNLPEENKLPVFDLILLGLGEDGHTASIFPDSIQIINSDKICEVTLHPDSQQKRITVTGNVINNALKIIFLVTGKSKAQVLKELIENTEQSRNYPASYIQNKKGNLIWMLDKDAASLLKM